MLFGIENETTSSVNDAFKAAYDEVVNTNAGNDMDSSDDTKPTSMLSSYISSTNSSLVTVVTTNVDEKGNIVSVKPGQQDVRPAIWYTIRPVLTIFKSN